ncbi:MAG TPA: hypothetical protein VEF04_09085, partial [Blastocatellia bacterium]|nr:hypothetical protein [Blastocatellia bacterium]
REAISNVMPRNTPTLVRTFGHLYSIAQESGLLEEMKSVAEKILETAPAFDTDDAQAGNTKIHILYAMITLGKCDEAKIYSVGLMKFIARHWPENVESYQTELNKVLEACK